MSDHADDAPLLRVVRGDPTAEELAALVAILQTRTGTPPPVVSTPSNWVRSTRPGVTSAGVTSAGLPADRGPHAWRASALPR